MAQDVGSVDATDATDAVHCRNDVGVFLLCAFPPSAVPRLRRGLPHPPQAQVSPLEVARRLGGAQGVPQGRVHQEVRHRLKPETTPAKGPRREGGKRGSRSFGGRGRRQESVPRVWICQRRQLPPGGAHQEAHRYGFNTCQSLQSSYVRTVPFVVSLFQASARSPAPSAHPPSASART